jgi:sulfate/thiosulfate transport system permease protein
LLNGLIDLPFAISPVVAGFMLIILYGPQGLLGWFFENHDWKVVYAFPGMLLATLFVTLPFVVKEISLVLQEIGNEQEQAATLLGANPWQVFWKITLPSIRCGLLYGITLTVARALGEFGAVLVVSGNIINLTQTATLAIYQAFEDFNYVGSYAVAAVLALISFTLLICLEVLKKKRGMLGHGN